MNPADPPRTGIRTFLIADVRGYTLFTQEHGDEEAAKLAAKFAAVARHGVEAHGGSVLELRGDEALAVFDSARQAVSAALDMQERFLAETTAERALPLLVGIGLDAGEAVPLERGYRGGALNLAARLCAKARPGECLASQAVVHLAGRVEGARYVDHGNLHFKGLLDAVRAFRVVSEQGDAAERFKAFLPARPPRRRWWSTKRVVAVSAVIVALAVGLVIALPQVLGGEAAHAGFAPGIVMVDAQTGEELASIPTSAVRQPDDVVYSGGHFWVEEQDPLSLVEIDTAGNILRKIAVPSDEIASWTVNGDTLWVSGHKVWKFDISLGREIDRFSFSDWHNGVVVAAGSLWLAVGDEVLRLDPATGRVQRRIADLPEQFGLAYGDGAVWTAGGEEVNRIDPETNAVTTTKVQLPEDFGKVAAGSGFGWTADPNKGVVYKIDPSGHVAATYPTGEGAGKGLSYSNGELWVANSDVGSVTAIDAITGARRSFRFGHPIRGVAAASGVVLATLAPGRTYEDRINELEGDVAKLFVPLHILENADPASTESLWIEYATCAALVRYPDAPAPEGWKLEPELAAAMPEVSDDGRVYSFRIRSGYRFSPPSNEVVTAETIRYSIERALSPKVVRDRLPSLLLDEVEGVSAYRAGKADHVSGLRAHGTALTITLRQRSPDFLERLALPFYCTVPSDSPLVPAGIGPYVGYPRGRPQPIPAAGPYYVADRLNNEFTILKRNPNYTGPRPHALDAIALREGVDAGKAVSRVEDGSWDGVVGRVIGTQSRDLAPLLEVGSALDQRWGPQSPAAEEGDRRYFASPTPGTGFILFNAQGALFADRTLRQAASHAIDRRALAEIWKLAPTDQALPAAMPGFRDRGFYRLDGPDRARARALMEGRSGVAVMGIFRDCEPCLQTAQVVKANLAEIGIRVRVERFDNPWDAARKSATAIDILDAGWGSIVADPANFLRTLVGAAPTPDWLPSGIGPEARRISRLEGPARVAAAAELADRFVEDAAVAAYGNDVETALLSPRLGCRVFPPLGYGIDLAALCLSD